jgi:hypothetical protein
MLLSIGAVSWGVSFWHATRASAMNKMLKIFLMFSPFSLSLFFLELLMITPVLFKNQSF